MQANSELTAKAATAVAVVAGRPLDDLVGEAPDYFQSLVEEARKRIRGSRNEEEQNGPSESEWSEESQPDGTEEDGDDGRDSLNRIH
jgi:hypothetical protein